MRTGLASVRDAGGLDSVNRAVRRFLDDGRHGEPGLESIRHAIGTDDPALVLAALIKRDLQQRSERGERPAAADYFARYPELLGAPERVLSLIYEEFCLSEERGERPDAEVFCARYAPWRDSLASQLRYHQVISQVVGSPTPPPPFPAPGEYFKEFWLCSELGRGGAARVFLAREKSLGERLVALKVSAARGSEPSILGRLTHPRIIPVHSVVFQPETRLQGLCMPYRPGLPLDEVIRRVHPAARPGSARALWEALTRPPESPPVHPASGAGDSGAPSADLVPSEAPDRPPGTATPPHPPHPPPRPSGPGWDGFPAHGSYADAVAWVGVALARALHYAHTQDIYHRDVKPANVLLTYLDGPQLLDFNLAHDPHTATQAEAALRGGTLPYMAPEQLRAFLDPERWEDVGAAADVYSLALLLRELLTGQAPETPEPKWPLPRAIQALLDRRSALRPDLRTVNPRLPHALEAILGRCLAADPDARYPDAATLADDLQRYLERRPLRHVRNPSRRERAANWSRRTARRLVHPAVGLLISSTVVLALGARSEWGSTSRPESTPRLSWTDRAEAAVKAEARGDFEQAIARLTRMILADGGPNRDIRSAPATLKAALHMRARVLTRWGQVLLNGTDARPETLERAEHYLSQAIDDLAQAARLTPDAGPEALHPLRYILCEARLGLGVVAERQGRLDAAAVAYREADVLLAAIRPYMGDTNWKYQDLQRRVRDRLASEGTGSSSSGPFGLLPGVD